MINDLMLQTGIDLPFEEAQLIIHQPKIKEIALIGEDKFFKGCNYLVFSKDKLNDQDKNNLKDLTDFEVLMTIMKQDDVKTQESKIYMILILSLLFPDYSINFLPTSIMLAKKEDGQVIQRCLIDKDNFVSFRGILLKMFYLDKILGNNVSQYNPAGPQAEALAKKFEERRKKLAKMKGQENEQINIIFRYISILAVGLSKNKNELSNYTVFQLFEEYQRFNNKQQFDIYKESKLAGMQDLDDVQYWMK